MTIDELFAKLYRELLSQNSPAAEECLGLVAEAQAIWLGENL
jgi:hypothetical protein